jgi:hypothetical protein
VRQTSPARHRVRALGVKLGLSLLASVTTMAVATSAATAFGQPDHGGVLGGHRDAEKPRTVVTTDMEQDDYASLIRYLLYTNELDTEGIIYTSGRFHWAGDGKGTLFFLPGREYTTPQTSWRWTGTRTIQDLALKAYADVFQNLSTHDRAYPTPADLLSKVRIGNIDFENSMDRDTPGSDLIKQLLLDDDRRPLYLQAWGGTNTIARALKSIEDQYAGNRRWPRIKEKVSRKAVILASGFQDETYAQYIAPSWPLIRVENLQAGYGTWGYNCNFGGRGNVRGLPADRQYFQGAWIKANIQIGPLGSLYRSWLDGQAMPGDQLDVFGDPVKAQTGWCPPLSPYDFLSEGDNVAFLPLLDTGIQAPENPALGGWGGRSRQITTTPDLWTMVPTEKDATGADINQYTSLRWAGAGQNDFAARMQWTLTPSYRAGNHEPHVGVLSRDPIRVVAGRTVKLRGFAVDPDGDRVSLQWWQYGEEGTYPGKVTIASPERAWTTVTVPADAQPGETISLILQGTDDGHFPLTRYARVILQVV